MSVSESKISKAEMKANLRSRLVQYNVANRRPVAVKKKLSPKMLQFLMNSFRSTKDSYKTVSPTHKIEKHSRKLKSMSVMVKIKKILNKYKK